MHHISYYDADCRFGGQYVPEVLRPSLDELSRSFEQYRGDGDFLGELSDLRKNFIGRPSPLIFAPHLTEKLGGAKVYLKNEGANLTGSHKINHCVYQALLAKRMGKTRVVCETGAGQHGVAVATVCARFGFECVVYMGARDVAKQYPNVFFMQQIGARVVEVTDGNASLTEAVDAAMGDYMTDPGSYYMLGSAVGPHPYPEIIREAQRVIGEEIRTEIFEREGQLPSAVVACIGGGSNALGVFHVFLEDPFVSLVGVEAGGEDIRVPGKHASKIASGQGRQGIMQGFKSMFLLDERGQGIPLESVAVGLKYVGIGPVHAYLHSLGRVEITSASNREAIEAFQMLAKTEGIICALESAHAIAEAMKRAPGMEKNEIIVVNVSGRGDNYLFNIADALHDPSFRAYCGRFSTLS